MIDRARLLSANLVLKAASAWSTAVPASASAGWTPQEEESVTLPCTVWQDLVFFELESVDGHPLWTLLDTGATASAIDPGVSSALEVLAEEEIVGTTGTLRADFVSIEGLSIGALEFRSLRASRRDLSGLLAPPTTSVDLILGSDALADLILCVDFEEQTVEFRRPSAPSGKPRTAAAIGEPGTDGPQTSSMSGPHRARWTLDHGIPVVGARLAGVDVSLRLDTGASLFATEEVYLNLPERDWQKVSRLHPEALVVERVSGTGASGESLRLEVYSIGPAILAEQSFESVRVIVQPAVGYFADKQARGFLGNNFLRRFGRITLDYPALELRFGR